jgi:hypothetical protein
MRPLQRWHPEMFLHAGHTKKRCVFPLLQALYARLHLAVTAVVEQKKRRFPPACVMLRDRSEHGVKSARHKSEYQIIKAG